MKPRVGLINRGIARDGARLGSSDATVAIGTMTWAGTCGRCSTRPPVDSTSLIDYDFFEIATKLGLFFRAFFDSLRSGRISNRHCRSNFPSGETPKLLNAAKM